MASYPIDPELLPGDESQNQEENSPYSEEVQGALKTIILQLEKEDKPVRDLQIRYWKKLDYFWKGIQYIYWSEVAKDWKSIQDAFMSDPDYDPTLFAKVINFYRAHGESIIAALSTGLPYVRFYPDDADDPDDVMTAKAFDKISELIQKHNKGEQILLKALYCMYNSGFAAAYNRHVWDKDYGTIQKQDVQYTTQYTPQQACPECGEPLDNAQEHDQLPDEPTLDCPLCGPVSPMEKMIKQIIPIGIEEYDEPKSREIVDVYSSLYVKVPHYVTRIEESPYLILETDHHYALLKEIFPQIADKIQPSTDSSTYDKWARSPTQYIADTSVSRATVKRVWLRPWIFNILDDDDLIKQLKKLFPDGVFCTLVNEIYAEACPEKLDDHWTLSRNPLSTHIHQEPIGEPYVQVQEMRNELLNLTMQTITFAIPETFADPQVLNFTKYSNTKAEPGSIYPAKPVPGKGLSDSFFTIKTASLSEEVPNFKNQLDQDGQFVLGSFPSLYGGTQEGGSKTLGEYETSRNQALQRLSTPWKIVNQLWSEVMNKATRSFAHHMQEDEKIVGRDQNVFSNSYIRLSQIQGKVGACEPESSEQFPVSWSQKRQALFQLLGMKDQRIDSAIFDPNNVPMVSRLLGFDDLYIPGEDERNMQLQEISELLKGQQVQPNQWDNHPIHIGVCRAFLNSPAGEIQKLENPQGFGLVVQHMMAHQQLMAPPPMPGPNGPMPMPSLPPPSGPPSPQNGPQPPQGA